MLSTQVLSSTNRVYIVQEYAPEGDLFRFTTEHLARLDDPSRALVVSRLFAQLCSAVAHIHSHTMIHRDIKPENVLLGTGQKVLLADFGYATVTSEWDPHASDICGTLPYLAPELLLGAGAATEKSDVWALGCTLFFMITGSRLVQGQTIEEVICCSVLLFSCVNDSFSRRSQYFHKFRFLLIRQLQILWSANFLHTC